MNGVLSVEQAGPGVTVQDLGREGHIGAGLATGGAADRLALIEAAALLGLSAPVAALEMAGLGGTFTASIATRIALTGARMRARIGDETLAWNATHLLLPGQRLVIGPADSGVYGYLSVPGGLLTPEILGSRSAHLLAGIGERLAGGERLPIGADPAPETPSRRIRADRSTATPIRVMPGPQTGMFSTAVCERFGATLFTRSTQGNRQGVRLDGDGPGFTLDGGLNIVSEPISPGDIQMTGDGVPYILLSECQTMGGYPRIGTVIAADLPRVAQAAPGTRLRFRFLTLEEADRIPFPTLSDLARSVGPLVRDVHEIRDLLSYQLISGVIAGNEPD